MRQCLSRKNEIYLWYQERLHSKGDTGLWKRLSFHLLEKWRKGIPGRGNSMGKGIGAWKRKPVRRMANSMILEYKIQRGESARLKVGYGQRIQDLVLFPSSKQPVYKLTSMSYLQVVGGLSRSINGGSALKNPNISVQEIKSLNSVCWFFSPSSEQGDCPASIRPTHPWLTNRSLEASQKIRCFIKM